MTTTLISIIGSPETGKYNPAVYELNGKAYEAEFFFVPLLRHYQPDKFYLLGTEESIWNRVEEIRAHEHFEYEKKIIPFGVNSKEIWQIFETIVNLPLKNTRLIIDITHGFRAIPFAVFWAALYFQSVREDVEIVDILYGNYEARDKQSNRAPVVHLKSFLDMHQWIRAARRFVQYGDGDLLIQKLKEHSNKNNDLNRFISEFQLFVDNLQLTFATQVAPQANKVLSRLTKQTKQQLKAIAPFKLLYPLVIDRLKMLEADKYEWQRQWRLADWFARNRQYSQAIIVLREMLITFTAELLGLSPTSKVREKKIGYFHTYLIFWQDTKKLRCYGLSTIQIDALQEGITQLMNLIGENLIERWRNLVDEVNEARNLTGHALMRGKSKDNMIDPEEQIERLKNWIQESCKILKRLQANQQLIKECLLDFWSILFEKNSRVFVIVNSGIHPIIEDLKRQFGESIKIEKVTEGNAGIEEELTIVNKVKDIVSRNHGAEFVIVPSGYPYLITLVYNTLLQITSKHPIYLQYDHKQKRYIEKELNPRKWLDE